MDVSLRLPETLLMLFLYIFASCSPHAFTAQTLFTRFPVSKHNFEQCVLLLVVAAWISSPRRRRRWRGSCILLLIFWTARLRIKYRSTLGCWSVKKRTQRSSKKRIQRTTSLVTGIIPQHCGGWMSCGQENVATATRMRKKKFLRRRKLPGLVSTATQLSTYHRLGRHCLRLWKGMSLRNSKSRRLR